jgi:hypothetical protein
MTLAHVSTRSECALWRQDPAAFPGSWTIHLTSKKSLLEAPKLQLHVRFLLALFPLI